MSASVSVTALVIDEADRMFDMGFIRDVRRIVGYLPRQRQSMLFSATMPAAVAHLVAEILKNPVRVDISPPKMTADRIDQRVYSWRRKISAPCCMNSCATRR